MSKMRLVSDELLTGEHLIAARDAIETLLRLYDDYAAATAELAKVRRAINDASAKLDFFFDHLKREEVRKEGGAE